MSPFSSLAAHIERRFPPRVLNSSYGLTSDDKIRQVPSIRVYCSAQPASVFRNTDLWVMDAVT